jgi:lipopolysaccharide transport system ATP-binding protein
MIEFKSLQLTAPSGSIIGVIEEGSGLDWGDNPAVLRHPLSTADAVSKARAISQFLEQRRAGATLILITHDEQLLQNSDEIWWLRDGTLIARGDPAEVLPLHRRHVALELRKSGEGRAAPLAPAMRNGDGRAELTSIELLGESGQPSTVFRSGESVVIRVTVRFHADIPNPVIGILIRTRIGLNVYGTNTELENLHPGPVSPGQTLRVAYRFQCDLCPGDYTVTAASHDPDGVWHDWQEDAVAFAVADSRYTAGVANLRAKVYAELTEPTTIP